MLWVLSENDIFSCSQLEIFMAGKAMKTSMTMEKTSVKTMFSILYSVVTVYECFLVFVLKREGVECRTVIVHDDQCVALKFQMLFAPCLFQTFKLLENGHVVGFLLEFRIFFVDDLQPAETLFKRIGAELLYGFVDSGIFGAGFAFYEGVDTYK